MRAEKEFYQLTQEEYENLKSLGYLYEFYPQATGNYMADMWAEAHNSGDALESPPEAPQSALETQVDGSHYVSMKMQPIELTYALNASPAFCKLAKYLTRDKGDKLTNLQKALHCIKLEQELVQGKGIGLVYSSFRKDEQYRERQHKTDVVKTIYKFTDDVHIASILINMYDNEYFFAINGVEELILKQQGSGQ